MSISNYKKTGDVQTVGATSANLIVQPLSGLISVLSYQVSVIGYDVANPSVTVALIVGQGGGINLGVITLLPNLIGGGIQKSAALLLTSANIQFNITATGITVVVTGAAGRTMKWVGQVEVTGDEP